VNEKPQEGDSWIDRRVSPSFLFVTGLLLAPAIIVQQNLIVKTAQTVVFLILALLSVSVAKRRLFIGSIIFMTTTIVVNLFSPVGRVMLRIGPLAVTRGALVVGLSKATTLGCLLYLSRFCIRPSVRLPGTLGRYVSETFAYLNKLLARARMLPRKNLVQRLDEIFDTVYNEQRFNSHLIEGRNTFAGVAVLLSLLVVNWSLVFFPFSALLGVG
jgi:hypothetical protein